MTRASLTALAVATLATAGAGTGVALAGNSATSHTLTLTAHTVKSHQLNNTFVQEERDTKGGSFFGYDIVDCAFNVSTHKGSCDAQFAFAAGSLFVHATVDNQGNGTGTVTGGTRQYKGATGTIQVTSTSSSTTRLVITYTT